MEMYGRLQQGTVYGKLLALVLSRLRPECASFGVALLFPAAPLTLERGDSSATAVPPWCGDPWATTAPAARASIYDCDPGGDAGRCGSCSTIIWRTSSLSSNGGRASGVRRYDW